MKLLFQAELLEQLRFELPAVIKDVSIQKIRLHKDKENTEKMVNQYNEILNKLDHVDVITFNLKFLIKLDLKKKIF